VLADWQPVGIILRVVAALITLVMASEVSARWMTFLTFRHAAPVGLSDPIFGLDVSFYVFKLPLYRFVVGWLLGLTTVTLVGSTFVYLFAQQIRGRTAMTHLSILGALFLAGKGRMQFIRVDYQLQRFALLDSSRGVVFGAGYTDVQARLPLLHLLTGIVALGALLLLVNIIVRRWRLLLIAGGAWLALSILGPLYPSFVQRFKVQPNELALERPYIEHNVRFARYAYGLESVEESYYQVTGVLTVEQLEANADLLDNVRLWDWKPLRTTYEQLQEIRTYYTFADMDVDRAYAA